MFFLISSISHALLLYTLYPILVINPISEDPLSCDVQFVTSKESVIYVSEGKKPLLAVMLKEAESGGAGLSNFVSKLTSTHPLGIFVNNRYSFPVRFDSLKNANILNSNR